MKSFIEAWRALPPMCSLRETADFLGYSPTTIKLKYLSGSNPSLHFIRANSCGEYRISKDSIARLVGIDVEEENRRAANEKEVM